MLSRTPGLQEGVQGGAATLTASGFGGPFCRALAEGIAELGLSQASNCLPQFVCLAEQVLVWNQRAGLTAIVEPEEMARKHFVDSLTCLLSPGWLSPAGGVDVGSGAGFPGLVLALAAPESRFTLVEASARKAAFLRHAISLFGVEPRVAVVQQRAEEYGRAGTGPGRGRFQLGFARAAAKLAVALEYVIPLLALGGSYIAQVGPGDGPALAAARSGAQAEGVAWETLGARLVDVRKVKLPADAGMRWLAQFLKYRETPAGYPRRTGVPARRPLQKAVE